VEARATASIYSTIGICQAFGLALSDRVVDRLNGIDRNSACIFLEG